MAEFILTQTGQEIQADLDLLDNNQAAQGQVLTANGSGGASWQNASGGDKLYRHNIYMTATSYKVFLTLYLSVSNALSVDDLKSYLLGSVTSTTPANIHNSSGDTKKGSMIFYDNNFYGLDETLTSFLLFGVNMVIDNVMVI